MKNVWEKIQPIKVASGWTIDVNNFYAFEPTPENMEWFYGSILISGHNDQMSLCFDSKYEPEGDPNGEYILDFYTMKNNKKNNKLEVSEMIGTKHTKDKKIFIGYIERFMFTGKYD